MEGLKTSAFGALFRPVGAIRSHRLLSLVRGMSALIKRILRFMSSFFPMAEGIEFGLDDGGDPGDDGGIIGVAKNRDHIGDKINGGYEIEDRQENPNDRAELNIAIGSIVVSTDQAKKCE